MRIAGCVSVKGLRSEETDFGVIAIHDQFWQIYSIYVQSFSVPETLFQPEGADYVHYITAGTLGFENLSTSLKKSIIIINLRIEELT